MRNRTGTYIAFHAEGETDPTVSDIRYYNLLQAWAKNKAIDFQFVNSHAKCAAVRDTSKRDTLARSLRQRLNVSKNMILILGKTTRLDRDWVPFEIEYAVDTCELPIIVAYTGYEAILAPDKLSRLWPPALAKRITTRATRTIHIPFKRQPLIEAIQSFDVNNKPDYTVTHYNRAAYVSWGLLP